MTYEYSLKIFDEKEKAELLKKLSERFGIKDVPGIITMRGKERVFLYLGSLTKNQIQKLGENFPVERVGVYFCKISDDEVRLSIEGAHLLKDQIKKNIFELNDEQAEQWMNGNELNLKSGMNGFVIMKYKDDFLGTGKASELKITNFIPKNRRLKSKD